MSESVVCKECQGTKVIVDTTGREWPCYVCGPLTPAVDSAADSVPQHAITLRNGSDVMLRISSEGFWVRGEKVEQGPNEATEVYEAFKAFLNRVGFPVS